MKDVKELHGKWQREKGYRSAYQSLEDEFAIARALIKARAKADLTQAELANRMKTSQSAIARLEGGKSNPSVEMLKRYAEATGTHLRIELLSTV